MNNRRIWFVFFGIMALAQLAVPLSMISRSERTISEGHEFWFRTAPVEPYDPLRGKYMTLSFDDVNWTDSTAGGWGHQDEGSDIFIVLQVDSEGFAIPAMITREPPVHTMDYVVAKLAYISEDSLTTLHISYPFTRFYMVEEKSSDAEQIYWDSNRSDTNSVTYAVVMVQSGQSVLTDVSIDGVSIRDLAGAMQEE